MSNNPIRLTDYVIKHGSHNQASHGRGGGSSGSGSSEQSGGGSQSTRYEEQMRTSLDEATKLGADTNGTFKIMRATDKKDADGLRSMRRSIIRDRQQQLNSGRPEARPMRTKTINMLAHLANGVNSGLASFEGKAPYEEVPQI
jgi:hypothetical protein